MLRFINICLVVALVALAYVIYDGKYEARALDEDIGGLRKDIETERDAVAVLRAEWSLLNRPERIERLAAKHLKLAPARPQQLVTLDTMSDSDFERVRTEAADETLPAASGPATKVKYVPVPGVASAPATPSDLDEALGSRVPAECCGVASPARVSRQEPRPLSHRLPCLRAELPGHCASPGQPRLRRRGAGRRGPP